MNPNYVHPYISTQWPYPMSSYFPPHYGWWSWSPYACGMLQHARNDRFPPIKLRDYGGKPFVVNIERAAEQNQNFRTALWTGKHLQVTLMSIEVGGDIGLEVHPNVDQFIRIEQGQGLVQMGERKDRLDFERIVSEDDAIMIPAGTWHNVTNIGHVPLKLYSIYAPPEHPFGTVHRTKAEAMADYR
ncbi:MULTISPECIES: cupin domain-containing protein [Geobacillus]|uniref:cupin domain-containing protein n=1 Tax=Geobacillus TaxID=129337 RepID=UPI0005191354|nr:MULTISPECIES: cupin domain-containing protein [Geobacillus]KOR92861.1 cupin [Geobacillus stearothermophilus ATCC 12980]MBR2517566.1 cupin domain-containing protein [Geobacillus sp.]MED3665257.1 cupin domain-containing protein [Geobacillus stearothermophilus]MED3721601.1 cupin domain-containing protein [Geobacillus stearothermophilus]MED3723208.1 cupin domain-containing protein [Geobacillus stearothermophilus]